MDASKCVCGIHKRTAVKSSCQRVPARSLWYFPVRAPFFAATISCSHVPFSATPHQPNLPRRVGDRGDCGLLLDRGSRLASSAKRRDEVLDFRESARTNLPRDPRPMESRKSVGPGRTPGTEHPRHGATDDVRISLEDSLGRFA